jgi:hypothetical protein
VLTINAKQAKGSNLQLFHSGNIARQPRFAQRKTSEKAIDARFNRALRFHTRYSHASQIGTRPVGAGRGS